MGGQIARTVKYAGAHTDRFSELQSGGRSRAMTSGKIAVVDSGDEREERGGNGDSVGNATKKSTSFKYRMGRSGRSACEKDTDCYKAERHQKARWQTK